LLASYVVPLEDSPSKAFSGEPFEQGKERLLPPSPPQSSQALRLFEEMQVLHHVSPDAACYLLVLHGCAEAGEWREAWRLRTDLLARSANSALGEERELSGASEASAETRDAGRRSLPPVLYALGRDGQIPKALALLQSEAEAEHVDANAVAALLEGVMARSEGMGEALEVARSLEGSGGGLAGEGASRGVGEGKVRSWGKDMLLALLRSCRQVGLWEDAGSLLSDPAFRLAPPPGPPALPYTLAVGACAQASPPQPGAAQDLVESMGPVPDANTYLELLRAFWKAGRGLEGVSFLLEPARLGRTDLAMDAPSFPTYLPPAFPRDLRSYHGAMHVSLLLKEYATVLRLWAACVARGLTPNAITRDYVIQACLSSGRWKDALRAVEESDIGRKEGRVGARQKGWVVEEGKAAGTEGGREGGKEEGLAGWREGLRDQEWQEFRPGRGPSLLRELYLVALTAFERDKDWSQVHRTLQALARHGEGEGGGEGTPGFNGVAGGRLARLCNRAVTSAARDNRWEAAVAIHGVMQGPGLRVDPDVITYNAVMRALSETDRHEAALDLLDEMVERHGLAPDSVSFTTLIQACGRAGEWRRALALLHAMEGARGGEGRGQGEDGAEAGAWGEGMSEQAVLAAVEACAENGEVEEGLQLCQEILVRRLGPDRAREERTQDALVSAVIFSTMITLACRSGALPRVLGLLETLREQGIAPDLATYTRAIKSLGREGYPEEAFTLFTSLRQDPSVTLDAATYQAALDVCTRGAGTGGESAERALSVLEGLEKDGWVPDAIAYQSVLQTLSQAGRWQEAVGLLRAMEGTERGWGGTEIAYTSVVNACAGADQLDMALRLLDEMVEEKGLTPTVVAYFAVVRACKRAGRWEQALLLLDDMEDRGVPPVSSVLEFAADACLEAGQVTHASGLLTRMRERGLDPPEGLYARAISLAVDEGAAMQALGMLCGMVLHGGRPRRPLYTSVLQAVAHGKEGGRDGGREGGWGTVFATLGRTASALLGEILEERGGDVAGRRDMRRRRQALELVREIALVAAAGAGDWRRALLLLREREALGEGGGGGTVGGLGLRARYALAIEACARAGRYREGVALLEGRSLGVGKMEGRGRVLSHVLVSLSRAGQGPQALALSRRALRPPLSWADDMSQQGCGRVDGDVDREEEAPLMSALRSQRLRALQDEKRRVWHRYNKQDMYEGLVEASSSLSLTDAHPATAPYSDAPPHGEERDSSIHRHLSWSAWQELARAAKVLAKERESGGKRKRRRNRKAVSESGNDVREAGGKESSDQGGELLWVLKAMLEAGVVPSRGDLEWSLQMLASQKAWDALEDLLEKAATVHVARVGKDESVVGEDGRGEDMDGSGRSNDPIKSSCLDVIGCNRLLHAMAQNGEGERSVTFLKFMRDRIGVVPDMISYTSAMDACGRGGDWRGALNLLETIEREQNRGERGLRANLITYTVVMKACAQAGQWQPCIALLERLMKSDSQGAEEPDSLRPDTIACNVALEACVQGLQPNAALRLLNKMEEGWDGVQGMSPAPDQISYTNVIRALRRGGGNGEDVVKTVHQILQRAKARKLRPDNRLYNSALKVYVHEGHWRLAKELLKDMDQRQMVPDEFTVRILTRGRGKGGGGGRERGQTLALLRDMQDRFEDLQHKGRRDNKRYMMSVPH
jgi:pentatricopeptide repeat protein